MQTPPLTTDTTTWETPLQIDSHEAALLFHVLRGYIQIKGYEISSNTTELMKKLDHYLFPSSTV